MRRFRWAILGLVLAVLAGGSWWYVTQRPLDVPVAAVSEDVPVTVFGLGAIEAQVMSRIGFEVAGSLVEVSVDHGDQVTAGQVMARLNPAAQEARVARAEAALRSAQAAAARAEALGARAEALLAQKLATAARRRELAARGAASVEAAEQAETEVATARADMALNHADAAVAQAAQAEARANNQTERTSLDKHVLRAPFDGIVVARAREPGAALNPGEAVFTLVAKGSYWAVAYVDEGRAGDLALGQKAVVTLRSRPGAPLSAEVVRIGLEADRVTEERRVYVRCRGCPMTPVLGEQAEVLIETGRLARARLVPEVAVHGYDGVSGTVWTVEDGRLARREVRFAARMMDARLAITDGLPDSVPVVVRVGPGFAVGRAARVVTGPAAGAP